MVLNEDIHEFDKDEKKETIFKKIYNWITEEDKDYERLVYELNYWKMRCGKVEKRYKRMLKKNEKR